MISFIDAVSLSRKKVVSAEEEVLIVSNFETNQLETFLIAYGKVRGLNLKPVQCGFNNLRFTLLTPKPEIKLHIFLLTLEDFFPELSYRSQSDWTPQMIEDLCSRADHEVERFMRLMKEFVEKSQAKSIIIPPFLLPPPLTTKNPSCYDELSSLLLKIQFNFWEQFREVSQVRIIQPFSCLAHLTIIECRDDRALFHKGFPYSIEACNALANECIQLIGEKEINSKKLLVTDLDGTLWKGIIGEDGIDSISAHPEKETFLHYTYQKFLKLLREEGVLLAVASKNNLDDVNPLFHSDEQLRKMGMLLARDHFAAFECSWDVKSTQVKTICKRLNILPADVVVVDDNPLELVELKEALPELTCIEFAKSSKEIDSFLKSLRLNFCKQQVTADDLNRSNFYVLKEKSDKHQESFQTVQEYLQSLQMKAVVEEIGVTTYGRPFQLYNKTNQFNLTGKQMAKEEWELFLNQENHFGFQLELQDIFGSHGIVLVCLAEKNEDILHISNMVLSCRVFNRTVETAFLQWIAQKFQNSCKAIQGRIVNTLKNKPCRDFFSKNQFKNIKTLEKEISNYKCDLPLTDLTHCVLIRS